MGLISRVSSRTYRVRTMSDSSSQRILYATFDVNVETAFWHQLAKKKIDELKLSDTELPINNLETTFSRETAKSDIYVNHDAFETTVSGPFGLLKNTNTIEEFKQSSKQSLLNEYGARLFDDLD